MRSIPTILCVAGVVAVSQPAAAADPREVVAAERAFAADGLAIGVGPAFVKHSTPDAIVFDPDPVEAHKVYGDRKGGGPPLVWWPVWAGIARSGDLGFTSGPATYDGKHSGWYFTVWARQADGGWKWVYDGGAPSARGDAPGPDGPVTYLAPATGADRTPEDAMAEVRAQEARLAQRARGDAAAALTAALAPDARVVGSGHVPAATPQAIAAELAGRAAVIEFAPLGGGASGAGDLAWTYGQARWRADGEGRRGHYVRIWRHDRVGWALVYDMVLPVRTPPT